MKTLIACIILCFCLSAYAAEGKTYKVGKGTATVTKAGEVTLTACTAEAAAVRFWQKVAAYQAKKGAAAVQRVRFGVVTVDLQTGRVKLNGAKLTPASREFWDAVASEGKKK